MNGIFRCSTIIAPIIVASIIFVFLSLYENIDITNFTPIFGNSVKEFFFPGIFRFASYEILFSILLLHGNIKDFKKVLVGSFLFTSAEIFIVGLLLFGIFPYPSILENNFPVFEIIRLISLGRFVQRLEPYYILIWFITIYIAIAFGTLLIVNIFSNLFNLKHIKGIIPMFCALILVGSSLEKSYATILFIRKFISIYVIPLLVFLYPFIILILANIKQKKEKKFEKA